MIHNNYTAYSSKIISSLIIDLFLFPIWWYTKGLIKTLKYLKNFLENKEKSLALFIWIKNIFVPMYGEYEFSGILISFFVRIFQIFVRSLIMFFWVLIAVFILIFWLALPVLTIQQIFNQILLLI